MRLATFSPTRGYAQLSMRKVAERIEYSPTAIYLHVEDTRDLVFQVCEETFGTLVVELVHGAPALAK